MLPTRGIQDTASAIMRYANTSSGRKTIGAGLAVGGTAATLYGYNRKRSGVNPMMGAGALTAMGGYSMIASGMR